MEQADAQFLSVGEVAESKTYPVEQQFTKKEIVVNRRRLPVVFIAGLIIVGLAVTGVVIILVVGAIAYVKTSRRNLPLATLPPPLANVEFPTHVIEYPSDWPPELRYPEQFGLVEFDTAVRPDQTLGGWIAKLHYQGDPKSAADLLSSFFTAKGWKVVERTELESGWVSILIERNGNDNGRKDTGVIALETDTSASGYTKIAVTVFMASPP